MNVWVTRDEERDGPLCTALRGAGLGVLWEPVLKRKLCESWDDAAVADLGADDWLVLTSPFAIELLAGRSDQRKPRVAVVAEASRELAAANGYHVALVSSDGTGATLFEALRQAVNSATVCYPRSSLADPPHAWSGVSLRCPILYETVVRDYDRTIVERVDLVAVASPSAVRAVGSVTLPFASIGPKTTAALHDIGIEPVTEALDRSFQSLAEAIARYANDSRQPRA